MTTELGYSNWTQLLCNHFFRKGGAQQSVTFFVDDDLLDSLEGSEDWHSGVESLIALSARIGLKAVPQDAHLRCPFLP
jgi:hypothetical protein